MKLDNQSRARVAKTYGFETWPKPTSATVLSGSGLASAQIQGYVLNSLRRQTPDTATILYQILWGPGNQPLPTVSSQVFEADAPAKAPELLLYLLGQFEGPQLTRTQPAIGDLAFSTKGNLLVIFERQNLVVVVSNIAEKPIDLLRFAGLLNSALKVDETPPPRPRARRK